MKILITGGAGFQGSHLAERCLDSGHQVTLLNTLSDDAEDNISSFRDRVSVVWGSVTDAEIVEKTVRGQDVVVHMAARINVDESLADPRSFLDVNVWGTLNVLEAVRQSGSRLIHASTCEVYGYGQQSPLSEHAELNPYSPYAASKAAADRMCFGYHKSFGVDVTILRPSNVYGPRQKAGAGGAVISIFTSLAASGKPLKVFGTGDQRREYIHVTDLVNAYDLVLKRDDLSGATINVGSGETPSIGEIASFISEKMGVPIHRDSPRPGEVPGFALDCSFIRSLGYKTNVRFQDGLGQYLDQRIP